MKPLDAGQEREWHFQQGQRGAWTRLTWRGRLAAAVALGLFFTGITTTALLAAGESARVGAAVGGGAALALLAPLVIAPATVTRWMVRSGFSSEDSLRKAADAPFNPGRFF